MCDVDVEVDVCGLGQHRVRVAGQADHLDAKTFDQRQQGYDFIGRAGVGQGENNVVARDHAHVAMAGFGRMHEKRGGPGACQCGGNLVADMPGLAHADHDDPALAGQNHLARAHKIAVEAFKQALYGFYLKTNGALRRLNQVTGSSHVWEGPAG